MTRSTVAVLGLVLFGTSLGTMQPSQRVLTTADYDRAVKMLAPSLNGLVVGGTVERDLAAGRPLLVRPHHLDRHGKRRHRPGEEDARSGGDASGRRGPGAAAARGGRGGRGGGGGGGRGGRGGGVAITKTCGPNVTGTTGAPPPSMSPDGSKAHLHLRLESLGARRRHRPGAPAHDRRREGLRLRDEQRRLGDERRGRRCPGRPTARRSRRSSRTSARSATCTSSRRRSTAGTRCCARGSTRCRAIRTSR